MEFGHISPKQTNNYDIKDCTVFKSQVPQYIATPCFMHHVVIYNNSSQWTLKAYNWSKELHPVL